MRVNLQKAEFVRSAAKAADFPRDRLPQVAFAGRSNVGKSSVINRLLNRKNFAKVSQAEKARWGRLMEEWFADSSLMTLGLQIVDARHKPTANDCTMAAFFKNSGRPFAVVANKLDKLRKSDIEPNLARIRETLELDKSVRLIPFSAEKGDGKQELLDLILEHAEGSL